MAVVALFCAADGIEGLDPVQAFQFRTSSGGGLVRDGLVLHPVAHDLSGDTALVRQLCAFVFRGMLSSKFVKWRKRKGGCRPWAVAVTLIDDISSCRIGRRVVRALDAVELF